MIVFAVQISAIPQCTRATSPVPRGLTIMCFRRLVLIVARKR